MTDREFYLERCTAEFPVTRRVLAALPAGRLDYRPDGRSPTAGELAWKLVAFLRVCLEVATQERVERRAEPAPPLPEMIALFDRWTAELAERVARLDDAGWARRVPFHYEGRLVAEQPVGAFLWFILFDGIHHRGQLSAYLRPMGGRVPAIYGPSADEPRR